MKQRDTVTTFREAIYVLRQGKLQVPTPLIPVVSRHLKKFTINNWIFPRSYFYLHTTAASKGATEIVCMYVCMYEIKLSRHRTTPEWK